MGRCSLHIKADVDERNAQVQILGKMFSSVGTLLVWIGEADDDSDEIFNLMPCIDDRNADNDARMKWYKSYLQVTNRPWFGRLWVLQELALARDDPIVVCCSKTTFWLTVNAAFEVLARDCGKDVGFSRKSDNVGKYWTIFKFEILDDLRTHITQDRGVGLDVLLLSSRAFQATDPKDHIYTLHGMLISEDHAHLTIDYRKPVAAVHAEVVAGILAKDDDAYSSILDPLSFWPAPLQSSLIQGLPSWLPNSLVLATERTTQVLPSDFHPRCPCGASGLWFSRNGDVLGDLVTLKVDAVCFDIVEDFVQFGDGAKTHCIG